MPEISKLSKPEGEERIGFLDIECSNLKSNFGITFSYCIKDYKKPTIYGRVLTPEEIAKKKYDKILLKECVRDMNRFDRIVTYYGTRFDIPSIRTRCLYFNIDFPAYKKILHTDVYYMVRGRLNLHRNRLETACDFFGIPSKGHRLLTDIWIRALSGDRKALKHILLHNKEDVISLEALYDKVKDFSQKTRRSI